MPFKNITFKETKTVEYNFSKVSTGIPGDDQYRSCVAVGNLVVFPPYDAGASDELGREVKSASLIPLLRVFRKKKLPGLQKPTNT